MAKRAYYNEFDPFAAAWLRELIAAGLIAPGDVDERSIKDVSPDDLRGYAQCHFFAGIGGWSYAARLAGWPDDRPLWTGSCPCQPFSVAGKGAGTDDARHLWPDFVRLIGSCRPPVVMGEQVAGKAGYGWLDGVLADLAGEGYAGRGVDIPACAVDAPHIRQRLYWVARASTLGDTPGAAGEWRTGSVSSAEAGLRGAGQFDGDQPVGSCDADEGVLALPVCERPGGWEGQPGRDLADRGEAGRQERPGGAADHDARGVDQVDASRIGRGEGRPEPELRGGRIPAAGADARHLADAQCDRPAEDGRDAGEIRGLQEAERRAEHDAAVSGREHGAPFDGVAVGRNGTFWSDTEWLLCHDGKARRTEPGASLLAHGVPKRVAKWRGFGNAIVPQVAAEVIAAFAEAEADDTIAGWFE